MKSATRIAGLVAVASVVASGGANAASNCGWYVIFDLWGACQPSYEERLDAYFDNLFGKTKPFKRWSDLKPVTGHYPKGGYDYDTLTVSARYYENAPEAPIHATTADRGGEASQSRKSGPQFDTKRNLHTIRSLSGWDSFSRFDHDTTFEKLAGSGQPAIEFVHRPAERGSPSAFSDEAATEVALVANPYKLGWSYQSFGVWESSGNIQAASFGAVTPAGAVPGKGRATFKGKLAGFYVSPEGEGSMASANVTVKADFRRRSLGFSSARTSLARDAHGSSAAPELNLSGTLTYSPDANRFAGTLQNAGGTMSGPSEGRYYGKKARELGGTFVLKSPATVETFTGAYGGRRR